MGKPMSEPVKRIATVLAMLLLVGCGGDWVAGDPDADGARFNRTFRYYFAQECRYDSFGVYDCEYAESISPAMNVKLRVDSDGLATLNVDGENFVYLEREYKDGYDPDYGAYFEFYEDDGIVTIYKDGSELIFWDSDNNTATFYLYELEY